MTRLGILFDLDIWYVLGCLDTAVDQVVEGIGHVLGKHTLGDDDSIIANGAVELSCGVFDRLRSREWLNC
jgi:hypothetical protein